MQQTLDPQLVQGLTAAAAEVLQTMAAMVPSATAATPPGGDLDDEYVGLLGFTGSRCGTFVVRCCERLARRVVANMLLQAPDELGHCDTVDGFGELVNMIGGSFKNTWVAGGQRMDLSVPTVIRGGTVRVDGSHDAAGAGVRLTFAEGHLFAGVLLEPHR